MIRPRVAIVGAGLMGRWHLDAARRAGGVISVVVDHDLARARSLAPRGALLATQLDELDGLEIDVVHICTPLVSHAELIISALRRSAHVIVEKPAVADEQSARMVMREAKIADRSVIPVHQFVWQRGMQQVITRQHEIGPLCHVEFITCSAGADHRPGTPLDTIVAEIVPHGFAIARALTAEPVGTLPWQLHRPRAGEWRLTANIPSGCSLAIVVSLHARPTFAACRVLGERGSATADLFHGFAVIEPPLATRGYKIRRPVTTGIRQVIHSVGSLALRAARQEMAYPGLRPLCQQSYDAFFRGGELPFRSDELIDVAVARDIALALVPDA